MSEYQYVAFRAVDRPLSDAELEFAEKQSSRAEITRWSFENEYNYGEFGGDVAGLLRHGYDVYLNYTNYGIRNIAVRLPAGLPFPKKLWSQYVSTSAIVWKKDRKGDGGMLELNPCHDGGELDEIWDAFEYVDSVVDIRKLLLAGDLRALYVLWLCAAYDDNVDPEELIEPPVPGGLAECVDSCEELLDFFGLDPLILLAASEGAPAAPAQEDQTEKLGSWIDGLESQEAKHLLQQLLSEGTAAVKARTLATINQARASDAWLTAALKRTFSHLLERAETLRNDHEAEEKRQRDAEALRERQKRLASMVKDPAKWLEEANSLVEARGPDNYAAAADILFDLRNAIGGKEGIKISQRHAAHLMKKHPTLRTLKSALRKRGVLE